MPAPNEIPQDNKQSIAGTKNGSTTANAAENDPFTHPDTEALDNVPMALFLLLRTQDITSEVFTCPSSNAEKWDFGGGSNTAMDMAGSAAEDKLTSVLPDQVALVRHSQRSESGRIAPPCWPSCAPEPGANVWS